MKLADSIQIDASPERVWSVTQEVERWPEWTPTVTSVKRLDPGPFGLGSTARLRQPAQPAAEWVVTEFEAGRGFAWETSRRGLHMKARHEVTADGAGTRNVLSVEATGIVATLLGPLLRIAIARALSAENRGLKSRCEDFPVGAAARAP
jgi:uncharacterized membrane protein